MSAVMMDNWSLENAFVYGTHDKSDFASVSSWETLIMAILLWDEIWYYKSNLSHLWESKAEKFGHSALGSVLYSINKEVLENSDSNTENAFILPGYYSEQDEKGTIEQHTAFYVILSNYLGVNLLVHPKRKFDTNILKNIFSRLDIWKLVDKELEQYYRNIHSVLGKEMFTFSHPLLFDYIRKNTNNHKDELKASIMLRENKDVVEFKSLLTEIEESINAGNTQTLLCQMKAIEEAAIEITDRYSGNSKVGKIQLNVSLLPFSFCPSFLNAIPIVVPRFNSLKIHTTFIKSVIQYGVEERRKVYFSGK